MGGIKTKKPSHATVPLNVLCAEKYFAEGALKMSCRMTKLITEAPGSNRFAAH
jgi:hypothetical protein